MWNSVALCTLVYWEVPKMVLFVIFVEMFDAYKK